MSIKKSIPYSQYLRLRRNCTDWLDFMIHSLKLTMYFQLREYPNDLLLKSLQKVSGLTQLDVLLDTKAEDNIKKFYCITDFNPSTPDIRKIVENALSYADRSSSTRDILNIPIIFGHRKPKNIADHLISTNLPIPKSNSFPPKCNKFLKNCKHCTKLMNKKLSKSKKTVQITSTSTNRTYKVPLKVSCTSTNLIYCIECPICKHQYVGQTKNKLLTRMNQHHSDIRLEKDTPVSRHFNKHHKMNKDIDKHDINIYVLQLIPVDDTELRNRFENHWISRLNTLTPKGLNILD